MGMRSRWLLSPRARADAAKPRFRISMSSTMPVPFMTLRQLTLLPDPLLSRLTTLPFMSWKDRIGLSASTAMICDCLRTLAMIRKSRPGPSFSNSPTPFHAW